MRIVVSGGGTAGHVSPVLAVADALKKRDSQTDLLYIGQRGGVEARMAREAGLPFAGILGGKYRRVPGSSLVAKLSDIRSLFLNLRDLACIAIGTLQSYARLRQFKPDVIFNKGGNVGLPVGLAARLLRIPMVIHEPDVVPGLGNKVLGRWATKIAVGFSIENYSQLPTDKLVFTGTPVRPIILNGSAKEGRAHFFEGLETGPYDKLPVVLVVGGTQGAKTINEAVVGLLPKLEGKCRVLHVVGTSDIGQVTKKVESLGIIYPLYRAEPFLAGRAMAQAYAAADVVVSRAGANTIAELAATGKASIVVPNRQAAAHQIANAKVLEAAEAAVVLSDRSRNELVVELNRAITKLLGSPQERHRLSRNIAKFNLPDSADRLADLIATEGSQ